MSRSTFFRASGVCALRAPWNLNDINASSLGVFWSMLHCGATPPPGWAVSAKGAKATPDSDTTVAMPDMNVKRITSPESKKSGRMGQQAGQGFC